MWTHKQLKVSIVVISAIALVAVHLFCWYFSSFKTGEAPLSTVVIFIAFMFGFADDLLFRIQQIFLRVKQK